MRKEFPQRRPRGRAVARRFPAISIDYNRRVYNLFGLVIDAVSKEEVLDRLTLCIDSGRRCHLVTPNANILRLSRSDSEFRDALLSADLSTLDGMPLELLARVLGLFATQVSGADLLETLQSGQYRKFRTFFFGGDEATSQRLTETLTDEQSGVVCVGALSPAFGPIDELTNNTAVQAINNVGADLLSVSVGARN